MHTSPIRVPLFEPDIGEAERKNVLACLESNWVAMGPRCEQFETLFAERVGTRFASALNSCTAALHLAVKVLDIGPGDEVVVPSLTFAATANAVVYCGARPIFADVSSYGDWTISPDDIEACLSDMTRAIIVMHYGGFPCDMEAIGQVAKARGIPIIEDACHGLGGTLDGKGMGTIGTIGCFSFYSNKLITTGEGGMLITDDPEIDKRCKTLRSHGMTAGAYDRMKGAMGYDIEEIGFNYRLDDIRAAVGLAQLDRLGASVQRRRDLVVEYKAQLANVPRVTVPTHGGRGEPAHYIFPILLDRGLDRDRVRALMLEDGIQTSMHYPPVHLFSHYRKSARDLQLTSDIADRLITLPLYPKMDAEKIAMVTAALRKAVNGQSRL